ncbi:DUF4169 family protein [Sphingomonas sp. MG17]|uniref:DUF4169 family protein n=1 Tax=Sphingomonas tagetis TaxID=2949092 RepID=A0A9X2HKN9_9SPHN|nr:DUF4169 family protein [Sphingomonas tagetis]MCP3732961.1 DUF4169 family protein [Sphingomonas tagetis]
MADIVNLNKARKTRAKAAAGAKAVENRAKFGRTKAEKARDEANRARIDRTLDDSKRD